MSDSVLDNLPPEWPDDLSGQIRAAIVASRRKLIALDDDPTGVQTVYDTAVLARWTVDDLAAELRDPRPVCFILTNSRSLPEVEAIRLNQEIAANLLVAARHTGVDFVIASRSDSTLRGHFPAETDALAGTLGGVDGVLLAPAFFEGGRYTLDNIHWVRDGNRLVPAAETEFARDATFGYCHSDLREWVEEKTGGKIGAAEVASLSIDDIRQGGPDWIATALGAIDNGRPIVVNAASYRDLDVVALGVLRTEAAGKRLLYRTAAGFVRVRAGLAERPLLSRGELVGDDAPSPLPGIVIVGSHVQRSGEQLAQLLRLTETTPIELHVPRVLDPATSEAEIANARNAADAALVSGTTPVIFTSRQIEQAEHAGAQLGIGQTVAAAVVDVVRGITTRPGWIVAKGGITSSDIGTKALGARRAIVLGQIQPGIPVWRLGPETLHPGLPYVVFPGNVGERETLAKVVTMLRGG